MSDVVRQQVVHLGHPIVSQGPREAVVLEDAKFLAALAGSVLTPSAPQGVPILYTICGVTEGDLDSSTAIGGFVVDATGEIVGVAEAATARGLRASTEEDELESVENGRLAPTVETTEQNDRLTGRRRSQLNLLSATVETEIGERDAV